MPQLGMFEVAKIDKRPMRIRAMHSVYGLTEGQTCGTCRHLICKHYSKRYYKCGMARQTSSAATDWRVSWQACGKWEAREEAGR